MLYRFGSDNLLFSLPDVTPSAVHVGNIVQGARMAWAQGRDMGYLDDDGDSSRKVSVYFSEYSN